MEREKVGVEVGMRDGRFCLPDERKPEPVGDALEKVLQMPSSSRSGVRIMMNGSSPPGEAGQWGKRSLTLAWGSGEAKAASPAAS
ncbi:MAG TPA: hypothetical protein VF118_05665, partial [Gemmatimonadaceae bacterium]